MHLTPHDRGFREMKNNRGSRLVLPSVVLLLLSCGKSELPDGPEPDNDARRDEGSSTPGEGNVTSGNPPANEGAGDAVSDPTKGTAKGAPMPPPMPPPISPPMPTPVLGSSPPIPPAPTMVPPTGQASSGNPPPIAVGTMAPPVERSATPFFLAVGWKGRRVVSYDGKTVARDTVDGPNGDNNWAFRGACSGNGVALAVGGGTPNGANWNARWAQSADGKTWKEFTLSKNWLGACAYGAGTFVIVGGAGIRAWSSDGETFDFSPTKGSVGPQRNVAFGDGVFVAVADSGLVGISSDGKNWTDSQVTNGQGRVVHGNGTFVILGASGKVYASKDKGATWKSTDVTAGLGDRWYERGLAFAKGAFYLSQSDGIYTSTDGLAWSRLAGSNFQPSALAFGDGVWASVRLGTGARYSVDGGVQWSAMAGEVDSAIMFGMIYKP